MVLLCIILEFLGLFLEGFLVGFVQTLRQYLKMKIILQVLEVLLLHGRQEKETPV